MTEFKASRSHTLDYSPLVLLLNWDMLLWNYAVVSLCIYLCTVCVWPLLLTKCDCTRMFVWASTHFCYRFLTANVCDNSVSLAELVISITDLIILYYSFTGFWEVLSRTAYNDRHEAIVANSLGRLTKYYMSKRCWRKSVIIQRTMLRHKNTKSVYT